MPLRVEGRLDAEVPLADHAGNVALRVQGLRHVVSAAGKPTVVEDDAGTLR